MVQKKEIDAVTATFVLGETMVKRTERLHQVPVLLNEHYSMDKTREDALIGAWDRLAPDPIGISVRLGRKLFRLVLGDPVLTPTSAFRAAVSNF